MDFFNELLKEHTGVIKNLILLTSEQVGYTEIDRKAIFDLYCENKNGEKFIVELQEARHNFFKDSSVFYSTFLIQRQAEKGEWNYELQAVYTIGILDFVFEEDKQNLDKMIYFVKLTDIKTNKIFYDKLSFIYLGMPKFNKNIDELSTHFEKWLYLLKNLHRLQNRPVDLQETIFNKLFETAEIAKFSKDEHIDYESSLKYYRDLKNSLDTAREEGEKAAKIMIAKNLLEVLDTDTIAAKTGLSCAEIDELRN